MSNPLISVVIPTHNRAHLLPRALESVFTQTYDNLEVIVVDDGSTDDTESVVRSRWGDRVRYHRQENQGVSVARNTGIGLAQGEYVAFLDSDDEWLPEKMQKQLAAFESTDDPKLGLVTCALRTFRTDYERTTLGNAPLEGEAFETLLRFGGGMGMHIGFLAHRKVFEAGVRFDPDQKALNDQEFLIAAAREFTFRTVPEILFVAHKEDEGEAHVSSGPWYAASKLRIMEKYASELEKRPAAYAKHHRSLAGAYYRVGDIEGTRKHLKEAKRLQPGLGIAFWVVLSRLNLNSFKFSLRSVRFFGRNLTRMRVAKFAGPFV